MNGTSRRAFTLVEALVVIFIVTILAALVLPALQYSRARSRQIECASRLANLGVALQAFEATHQHFPPAQPTALKLSAVNNPVSREYSAQVYLLPYLEQNSLFSKIDLRQAQPYVWDPAGLDIMREPVAVFRCPADSSYSPGRPGNNYRISMGPGPYSLKSPLSPGGGTGAFTGLTEHGAAAFRDGLSYTVGMSEKLTGYGSPTYFDRKRDFWYSGAVNLGTQPPLDQMVSVCAALSAQPSDFHPYSGATWLLAGYENTWYNHSVRPNSAVPDCAVEGLSPLKNISTNGGVFGANSNHRGGVNCLFMGGSTKFIADAVDLTVWRALATRAGGEVVGTDTF